MTLEPKVLKLISVVLRSKVFKIAVSAGLILWLILKLDLRATSKAFSTLSMSYFVLALVTFAASLLLGNIQWLILLRIQGIRIGFWKTLSFYFVGAFFNNFLPANIGGDVIRIYDVYKQSNPAHSSIAATVTDRLFGMLGLAFLAVPAGLAIIGGKASAGIHGKLEEITVITILAFVIIIGLAISVILSRRIAAHFERLLRPILIGGLREKIRTTYESFHLYSKRSGSLVLVVAVAILVQILRTLVHYEISEAMGLGIHWLYFFVFIPLIALFIALPISIGGLGVREGLTIFFFCNAIPGLERESVFTMGLLAYFVGIIVSLIGGVIYFLRVLRGQSLGRVSRERREDVRD